MLGLSVASTDFLKKIKLKGEPTKINVNIKFYTKKVLLYLDQEEEIAFKKELRMRIWKKSYGMKSKFILNFINI